MSIADTQSALVRLRAASEALSLPLPADLPYEEWAAMLRALGLMDRAARFWLGDALNYGEARYGEKYSQAINDTGLAPGTLRNIAYVSRQYPVSRRRDKVAWVIHADLAALPDDEREEWLNHAERWKWTRADLREQRELALTQHDQPAPLPPLPDDMPALFGSDPVSIDGSPILQPWPVRAVADDLLRDSLPTPAIAHGPQTRAWCRCPQGQDVGRWALALAERWQAGELSEVIALLPVASDSQWWQALGPAAICLVSGWLDGEPGPWALCYLGPRPEAFAQAFGGIGRVWLPWEGNRE